MVWERQVIIIDEAVAVPMMTPFPFPVAKKMTRRLKQNLRRSQTRTAGQLTWQEPGSNARRLSRLQPGRSVPPA